MPGTFHIQYSFQFGKIKIRGKIEIEKGKGGKDRMVITEIPYTMFGGEGAQARLLQADGIAVVDGRVDLKIYGVPGVEVGTLPTSRSWGVNLKVDF